MLNLGEVNGEGSDLVIINDGEPGIVENITMTAIEIGTASTNSAFIKFTFQDENGGTLNQFEFDVDPSSENAENKQASQLKRLKHIVTKFVPEGTPLPNANTFPELYAALEKLLIANNYQGVQLRGKLVYNYKNYISFPKYVPFLENMDVAIADTRLKIGKIDKMEKSTEDSAAALVAPPPMAAGAPPAGGGDLPF